MQHRQFTFQSVFVRLICLLLCFFVPLFVGIIAAVNNTVTEMNRDAMNTLHRQLDAQLLKLEEETMRIASSQLNVITSDSDIIPLMARYGMLSAWELGESVAHVHDKLTYLSNLSTLLRSTGLYMAQIERELSTEIYYIDEISDITRTIYRTACAQRHRSMFLIDGAYYVVSLQQTAPSRLPDYMLYARLDLRKMTRFVQQDGSDDSLQICHRLDDVNLTGTPFAVVEKDDLLLAVDQQPFIIKHDGVSYMAALRYSPFMDCYILSYSAEITAATHYQHILYILAGCGCMLIAALAFIIYYHYLTVRKPLMLLLDGFARVECGDLSPCAQPEGNNEFARLVTYFNQVVAQLNTMIDEVYVKDLSLKEAELKRLQAQISPHFLYNSFSIISHAVHIGDDDCAQQMTRLLADYFKYITRNTRQTETLANEVGFARTYAQIQAIRFDGRIQVDIEDVPPQMAEMNVPKMIIQPLIENAYKHGLKNCETGGRISLCFIPGEESVAIRITDNGEGLSQPALEALKLQLQSGQLIGHDGLSNVHQRLTMLFPGNPGLQLSAEEGRYFTVELYLPVGGHHV